MKNKFKGKKVKDPLNIYTMFVDEKKKIINHNFLNGITIMKRSEKDDCEMVGIIEDFSFQGIKNVNTESNRGKFYFSVNLVADYVTPDGNKRTKWYPSDEKNKLTLLIYNDRIQEIFKNSDFTRLTEKEIKANHDYYYPNLDKKLPEKGWTIGYCDYETGKWRILKRCENDREKEEYLENIYKVLDDVEIQTLFLINDKDYMLEA